MQYTVIRKIHTFTYIHKNESKRKYYTNYFHHTANIGRTLKLYKQVRNTLLKWNSIWPTWTWCRMRRYIYVPMLHTVFSRVMYVPPIAGSLTFAKNAIVGTYTQYTATWSCKHNLTICMAELSRCIKSSHNKTRNVEIHASEQTTHNKAIGDSWLCPRMRNLVQPPWESRWIIRYIADSKFVSVFSPLCENMMSSTKLQLHNVLHCCQTRTKPQQQVIGIAENLAKFRHVVLRYASSQRDIQTRWSQYFATLLAA